MKVNIPSANTTVTVERTHSTLTVRHGEDFCRYEQVAGDWEPAEMTEFFSKHWTEQAEEELWVAIRCNVTPTKFTPGPWHVNTLETVLYSVHANRGCVAEVSRGTMGEVGADEMEANTRLIAAAPELFNALQRIARTDLSTFGGDARRFEAWVAKIAQNTLEKAI